MTGDVLLVFVKNPKPGLVKSRLAVDVGDTAAALVYRLLAEDALRRTRPEPGDYERRVCFAPAKARAEVAEWLPGETLEAQQGAELGARMSHAFAAAFERGARRVALTGSDVPGIDRPRVREALRALAGHDAVLGPARDGGYYLVALARPQPRLFEGMAWSRPDVLARTLERAAVLALRVRVQRGLRDVDTLADLRAAWTLVGPLLRASEPDACRVLERRVFAEEENHGGARDPATR